MSNDLKYVLLPSIEERRRSPKFQPWYRERIKMKYPCTINTRNWKFVKDGLDDFRDGLPPPHDDIMIESEKGPGPVLISEHRRIKESAKKANQRFTDDQMYYSRVLPAAEKRQQTIQNYITMLLDHPLAFFSHFSQVLSPENYERMTRLLEAELSTVKLDDGNSSSEDNRDFVSRPTSTSLIREVASVSDATQMRVPENSIRDKNVSTEISAGIVHDTPIHSQVEATETASTLNRTARNGFIVDESGNQWNAEEYERKQKNPYRWYIEKQREKQKAKGPSDDELAALAMEARLKAVSEQFCSWLYDLGGDNNQDIDPAVVRNLFSTAYDTKPSLSVPIKIVEMTRVPPELREGVQDSMIPTSRHDLPSSTIFGNSSSRMKDKDGKMSTTSGNKRSTKYRYGAWYLPKTLWHRAEADEGLRDPKLIQAELDDPSKKEEEKINALLAPLHIIDAFKEYSQQNNNNRLPKLITDVEQYRREHPPDTNAASGETSGKRLARRTLNNED